MKETYIHLITGGERSGKSSYAERIALQLCPTPTYLATARVWDEEFAQRIRLHQERRGPEWHNVEAEKYLADLDLPSPVVLVDCVTLWATNFFYDLGEDVEQSLIEMKAELARLCAKGGHFILVTNELGMGGVSPNASQRRFTSLQGWMNQHIASLADEVTLMVSGIPVRIK